MKKTEKGMPGYLNYKRKIEIIRTLAYFGIVIAILLLGYFQTGTKLNLLTVVAIVGCLPASKALVGVITRFPYRSIDGERAKEIASKTDLLTVCYDMVITSRDHIMPVDCIVISGHNIFGYTHYNKVNTTELADHIKTILAQNGYKGFQIRILNEYKPFITRAEGLNNIAAVEQEDTKTKEETVRGHLFSCTVQDFSDGGLGIKINGQAQILEGQKVNLLLKRGQQEYVFPTQVARVMGNEVGLKLMPLTTQQHIDFVQCTFARADTWALWQDSYPEDKPLESLLDILKLGFRGYRHLAEFAPSSVKGIFRVLTSLVSWVVSFIPRRPERSETAQPSDQALAQQ